MRSTVAVTSGHVNVDGVLKPRSTYAVPVMANAPSLAEQLRHFPGVRSVVGRMIWPCRLVSGEFSDRIIVMGIDPGTEPKLRAALHIEEGSFDSLRRPGNILLFRRQATKFKVGLGDPLTITGRTIRQSTNAVDLQVGAIASDVYPLYFFFTSNETVRSLALARPDASSRMLVDLDRPDAVAKSAVALRAFLAKAGRNVLPASEDTYAEKVMDAGKRDWVGERIDVSTWRDQIGDADTNVGMLAGITWVLAVVLLAIIVVGLMNTLWVVIRERTPEIGTLRAIGMSRARVMLMFLIETGVLASIGTAIGTGLGIAGVFGINAMNISVSVFRETFASDRLHLVIAPPAVVVTVIVIVALLTLFSLYPALRASRVRPAIAMRHVG